MLYQSSNCLLIFLKNVSLKVFLRDAVVIKKAKAKTNKKQIENRRYTKLLKKSRRHTTYIIVQPSTAVYLLKKAYLVRKVGKS